MLFKVRGIDVKQVYTHSVCSREYTFPESSNDRGSFSVILVDFSSSLFSFFCFVFLFLFLFSLCFWFVASFLLSHIELAAIICIPLCFGRPETLNHCQQTATTSSIFRSFFFPSLPHYISFSFHFIACFSLLCLHSSLFYFFPLYDSPLFHVALSRVSSLRYEFFFHSLYSFKTIMDEISLRTNSASISRLYTYILKSDIRYALFFRLNVSR